MGGSTEPRDSSPTTSVSSPRMKSISWRSGPSLRTPGTRYTGAGRASSTRRIARTRAARSAGATRWVTSSRPSSEVIIPNATTARTSSQDRPLSTRAPSHTDRTLLRSSDRSWPVARSLAPPRVEAAARTFPASATHARVDVVPESTARMTIGGLSSGAQPPADLGRRGPGRLRQPATEEALGEPVGGPGDGQPGHHLAVRAEDGRPHAADTALVLLQVERVAALADPLELGPQVIRLRDRAVRVGAEGALVRQP